MNKHDDIYFKALVVDDDLGKGNLVKAWLDNYKIKTKVVSSYSDAVNELQIKYDYLFIDFFLDGKCTGDNFAKVCQKKYQNCKVVMYSGRPDMTEMYGVVDFGNLENYIKEIMVDIPERKEVKIYKNNIVEIREIKNNILKNTKSINIIENSVQLISEQLSQVKDDNIPNIHKSIELMEKEITNINEKLEKKNKFKQVILWITDLFTSMYKIIRGKNDNGKDKEASE